MRRGQAGQGSGCTHPPTHPPPAAARCHVASRHARLQNNNQAGHAGSATAGLERGAKVMTDAFLLHSPPSPQPTPSSARPPTQPPTPHPPMLTAVCHSLNHYEDVCRPAAAQPSHRAQQLLIHPAAAASAEGTAGAAGASAAVGGWVAAARCSSQVRCSQKQACQTAPPAQHTPNQPAGRQAGRQAECRESQPVDLSHAVKQAPHQVGIGVVCLAAQAPAGRQQARGN